MRAVHAFGKDQSRIIYKSWEINDTDFAVNFCPEFDNDNAGNVARVKGRTTSPLNLCSLFASSCIRRYAGRVKSSDTPQLNYTQYTHTKV